MDMNLTEEEYMLLIGQLYCEKKKTAQLMSAVMKMKDEQSEINTKLVAQVKQLEEDLKKANQRREKKNGGKKN